MAPRSLSAMRVPPAVEVLGAQARSVSTKPWSSRAAQPDSQPEAGLAPMKENSPVHGSVSLPPGPASSTGCSA
jgi:hypothetical protein